MKNISLVCTVHAEAGAVTVSELHAILERYRPEVIFLEIPPSAYGDYYETGVRKNLESLAVSRYRETHDVELIPVDLPAPEEEFFDEIEKLHKKVEGQSIEYRRLIDQHRARVRMYGFGYLNSEFCSNFQSELDAEMQAMLKSLGDPKLNGLYKLWNETIELRDNAMMKSIQSYCGEHSFSKGMFLVGAAHRQSIIEKSGEQHDAHSNGIQWDFSLLTV